MDLLITYDVETATPAGRNRLRRVARICEAYGHRVQKSVFEIVCRDVDEPRLIAAPTQAIDHDHDTVRLYQLPPRALDDVEHLGTPRQTNPRDPLVI
jgi:CRISPR-associated endonuclease Cas2